MYIKVPQGREYLDEVCLSWSGPLADSKHPKDLGAFHSIKIPDVGEVEGILQQGGLYTKEVDFQAVFFLDGNHLPHKMHQLL